MHTETYLDGDAKVISIFYFGDEVQNPAGDLQRQESFYSQNDSLFQPNSQFYKGNCFIIHLYSDSDSLTVMMVSRKAQISGFTLCRSAKIFSFPLMKPHLGAEVGRGEIRHFIHRHEHFVSTPKKR